MQDSDCDSYHKRKIDISMRLWLGIRRLVQKFRHFYRVKDRGFLSSIVITPYKNSSNSQSLASQDRKTFLEPKFPKAPYHLRMPRNYRLSFDRFCSRTLQKIRRVYYKMSYWIELYRYIYTKKWRSFSISFSVLPLFFKALHNFFIGPVVSLSRRFLFRKINLFIVFSIILFFYYDGLTVLQAAFKKEKNNLTDTTSHIIIKKKYMNNLDSASIQVSHKWLARYHATIKGNLHDTAIATGIPISLMDSIIKIYAYDVDFQRDISEGDDVEILAERFIDSQGMVHSGTILTATLTLNGHKLEAYHYASSDGKSGYFFPDGTSLRKDILKTPVTGANITSGFGIRPHPILGFSMLHKGIDFAVSPGTSVLAAADGQIDYVGTNGAYGRYVRIRHDNNRTTAYAHLSDFAKNLKVGQRIAQGDVIGYTGSSGRSTGPHLHFEILVKDQQVNPENLKSEPSQKLFGTDLALFQYQIQKTQEILIATPVNRTVALSFNPNSE